MSSLQKLKEFIAKIIEPANIRPIYANILLDNIELYQKAFTAKSYDPINNYEILEFMGDGLASHFFASYFIKRFPQLDCNVGLRYLAQLKIVYGSKEIFSKIADKLGFFPFIRAEKTHLASQKKDLLEDVFEAFLGTTELILDEAFDKGVGYSIIYDILKYIFDDITISLQYEDLSSAKSRLKELFDQYVKSGELGTLEYVHNDKIVTLFRKKDNERIYLAHAIGNTKAIREEIVSKNALKILERQGFKRNLDVDLIICN